MRLPSFGGRGPLFGVVLLLTLFVSGLAAPSAAAHNELTGSTPKAGAVVAAAPTTVGLEFAQDIDADFASVAVTAADTDVPVKLAIEGSQVNVLIEDLPAALASPGEPEVWKLGFRMISKDGHPVSGLLEFTVDPATGEPAASTGSTAGVDVSITPAAENAAAQGVESAPDTAGQGGISGWVWATIVLVVVAAAAVAFFVSRNRRPATLPPPSPPRKARR